MGFGQRYHVDRHGQLALKQLRLSVLNEMHTNLYTGPRLNAMSRKIKSDSKHRDLNLTQLSEKLDRLELVYKTTPPKENLEVNNFKTTGEADEISLRKIIREEVEKRTVGFVGKRNFPPKPRSGKTGKNQGCFHCQSPEHFRKDCPFKDLCQRCWQKGHTAPSCNAPSPRPSPSLNSKAAGNNISSAKINSFSTANIFITLTGTVVQSGSREFTHEFICDSGAEGSVIPTALAQEHYMKIQPTTRHVKMANGTHAECRGVVQTSVTVGTNSCILRFLW